MHANVHTDTSSDFLHFIGPAHHQEWKQGDETFECARPESQISFIASVLHAGISGFRMPEDETAKSVQPSVCQLLSVGKQRTEVRVFCKYGVQETGY